MEENLQQNVSVESARNEFRNYIEQHEEPLLVGSKSKEGGLNHMKSSSSTHKGKKSLRKKCCVIC
ncbi:uncharacterized protein SOCG_06508 [Schizosaccharomyces octosporus yFS286]|uniref:Uncharacterized protein n=1 Tax=Schizosaccharomyces octosporus (strain yFS286) TaxID=483514 RepID=S9RAU2_SCHOY|nr:uncharacterized protein SOCG_06508 [Schizosaccharomyces octosporus yFS286]EPX71254.1 hypothetical protein SOCG_06508 [Schizosaccharomyces octosporus yFS286]